MNRADYSHLLLPPKSMKDTGAGDIALEYFEAHSAVQQAAFHDQFGDTYPPGGKAWLVNCWGLPLSSLSISAHPPGMQLRSWHHVSCGPSIGKWDSLEPQNDPAAYSGYGFEFVISLPSREQWAASLVSNLIRYALGEDAPILNYQHTIDCRVPIQWPADTLLRHITITEGTDYNSRIRLPSGNIDFFHLVGITDGEAKLIHEASDHIRAAQALCSAILQMTGDLVTEPERSCYADSPAFRRLFDKAIC